MLLFFFFHANSRDVLARRRTRTPPSPAAARRHAVDGARVTMRWTDRAAAPPRPVLLSVIAHRHRRYHESHDHHYATAVLVATTALSQLILMCSRVERPNTVSTTLLIFFFFSLFCSSVFALLKVLCYRNYRLLLSCIYFVLSDIPVRDHNIFFFREIILSFSIVSNSACRFRPLSQKHYRTAFACSACKTYCIYETKITRPKRNYQTVAIRRK